MTRRVVIIGAGTAGTLVANRLRRHTSPDVAITVIDGDNEHVYQPGLLFVPFGLLPPDRLVRPRSAQLHAGVEFVRAEVDRVDLERDQVVLADATAISFDVLVVASGARLMPEETEGLAEPDERVHTFYSLPGATKLAQALDRFDRGRLVINLVDLPIKCPVAPLEFCFLADWYLHRRGIRDQVELTYVTPLDGAFTTPTASEQLGGLLGRKSVRVVPEFATAEVDHAGQRLVSFDEREVGYDLAVMVPVHGGAEYVTRSDGLGDALGFVATDEATLQSKAKANVFAIGDATDLRASKAGSVAHFEGEILVANIEHYLAGRPLSARYDGHTNCFIETGFGRALLIDFNYAHQPGTGHFPGPVGLPLLKESRLNHLGKLAFERLYWHAILPGRPIPLIGGDMPTAGKNLQPAQRTAQSGGTR